MLLRTGGTSLATDIADKHSPMIGRFVVTEHLGKGGQGTVFKALDPQLGREVALKVIKPRNKGEESTRIVEEARIAARIAHPNVIPLYDVFEHGGQTVLVFEYVPGQTLKTVLRERGGFPEREALSIMVRITVGLAAAHERGILHLDLTPGNVMLCDEGRPRIMDFGLARLVAAQRDEGLETQFKGTPRYLAPEHLSGLPLTAATDIYSLGLVFFEVLLGKPARQYETINDLFDAVRLGLVDWSRLHERKVSTEIIALLREMLQTDQRARYQSATELVGDLDRVIRIISEKGNVSLALDFLKRRIRRRPDFPAFSTTLAEINTLTDEQSNATFDDLGRVIMRDYSLTNRVMKVANSAFFDRGSGGAASVPQAVARLGLNTVRMVCNGLLVFDKLGQRNDALKDALVRSFMAAMVARGMVARHNAALAGEAFVCGLFQHLGRHLVMFYLEHEQEDIEAAMAAGKRREEAEVVVLGTASWRLGQAVAGMWNFPDLIVRGMEPVEDGSVDADGASVLLLRYGAGFGNDFVDAVGDSPEEGPTLLAQLMTRYPALCGGRMEPVVQVLELSRERFAEIAPTLDVTLETSPFLTRLDAVSASLRAYETDTAM